MSTLSHLSELTAARNKIAAICHPTNLKHIDHDLMTMLYDAWIFLNQLIVEVKEYGHTKSTRRITYRKQDDNG
jgi:hypothetical protein